MAAAKVIWIQTKQKYAEEFEQLQSIAALVGVELPPVPYHKRSEGLMYILETSRERLDHRLACLDLIEQGFLATVKKPAKKAADSE